MHYLQSLHIQCNSELITVFVMLIVIYPALLQQDLARYIVHLIDTLSASSVPLYLNVVRLLHLENNCPNPIQTFYITALLQGIRRELATPPSQSLPITPSILYLCPRCWISQALWLYIFILPIFRSFLSPWRGVICLFLRHSLGSYKDPRGLELGCLSEIPIVPTHHLPSYSPSPTIKSQILGIGVFGGPP